MRGRCHNQQLLTSSHDDTDFFDSPFFKKVIRLLLLTTDRELDGPSQFLLALSPNRHEESSVDGMIARGQETIVFLPFITPEVASKTVSPFWKDARCTISPDQILLPMTVLVVEESTPVNMLT